MSVIKISGWFYYSEEEKDDKNLNYIVIDGPLRFDTLKLDMSMFKYSCKEFDTVNLRIIPMIRFVGRLFSLKRVQAVIDVTGSNIPFFVEQKTVIELEKLISNETNPMVRL